MKLPKLKKKSFTKREKNIREQSVGDFCTFVFIRYKSVSRFVSSLGFTFDSLIRAQC